MQPWHRNIALVQGDAGLRFENAVAVMLHKQAHFISETRGQAMRRHTIRTKDGAEVDLCLSLDGEVKTMVEWKLTDTTPHRALVRFAGRFLDAEAVQLVRDARQLEVRGAITMAPAGEWLAGLAARGRWLCGPGASAAFPARSTPDQPSSRLWKTPHDS